MPGSRPALLLIAGLLLPLASGCVPPPEGIPVIPPALTLLPEGAADLDDMCVWIHPAEPARSLVIVSDKKGDRILAYDLGGSLLQALPAEEPGNIDLRYGFSLGGEGVDIAAYFQRRAGPKVVVLAVDPGTRALRRIDDGAIRTGRGAGGALYRSARTGRFYFFKTLEGRLRGSVEQIELLDDGRGRVGGRKVREWQAAGCEGAVADDETGRLYIAEEDVGIREVGAEPGDPVSGELVILVGEHGLAADVEGLALYPLPGGDGYLVVSNQSRDNFKVYRRGGAHEFVGTFTLQGVLHPDGIEVVGTPLGPSFPKGLFANHTDRVPGRGSPVMVTRWDPIAGALGMTIDTSRDPRAGKGHAAGP